MKRLPIGLDIPNESSETLRIARTVFGGCPDLFADLLAAIDLELTRRDLPTIAEESGAHLVVAPREVA